MNARQAPVPAIVMTCGISGLLPFVVPPLIAVAYPAVQGVATGLQALYAALILSFLGGARWGLEVRQANPRALVVTLAMLPTLAALALLLVPAEWRALQLAALAVLLLAHLAWDVRSSGLPAWYPRLRMPLTLGSICGLLGGAVISLP